MRISDYHYDEWLTCICIEKCMQSKTRLFYFVSDSVFHFYSTVTDAAFAALNAADAEGY